MKWGALFLGLVSAISLYAFLQAAFFSDSSSWTEQPTSGMALLNSYRCHRAETKRVLIRGVEDDFSPKGEEPARIDPARGGLQRQANYDDPAEDAQVHDYFELASSTVSGIIVVKLRPVGDVTSDGIQVGDWSTAGSPLPAGRHRMFAERFLALADRGRWSKSEELYWASFEDLPLLSGGTVLTLIQSAGGKQIVGVGIGDDLSVDFIGVAACEPPKRGAGLSMAHKGPYADRERDLVAFACDLGPTDCNPFTGDQPCERELPLLCHIDRQTPAPRYSDSDGFELRTQRWSGGEVAATPPVSGGSFKTISDADRYCAAQFGKNWRVAEWHIGGRGWGFSAKAGGRVFSGAYWIDIRNQPYATCWSRDRGP